MKYALVFFYFISPGQSIDMVVARGLDFMSCQSLRDEYSIGITIPQYMWELECLDEPYHTNSGL